MAVVGYLTAIEKGFGTHLLSRKATEVCQGLPCYPCCGRVVEAPQQIPPSPRPAHPQPPPPLPRHAPPPPPLSCITLLYPMSSFLLRVSWQPRVPATVLQIRAPCTRPQLDPHF